MKLLLATFALGLLCLVVSLDAQTLPRKGMIGVGTRALDEATAKANNLKIGEGLLVAVVVPNSTLADLGIKVGDIITSVNQKTFATHESLVTFANTVIEGDSLENQFYFQWRKIY